MKHATPWQVISRACGLRRTSIREKPGISPLLLGRMLLSNAVFMRLSDCVEYLQPYEEDVIELAMHPGWPSITGTLSIP